MCVLHASMAHIIGDIKTEGAVHESGIHYSDEVFSDGVAFPPNQALGFGSFDYIAGHHDEVVVYDDLLPEAPTNAFLTTATSRTHSPSPLRAVSMPWTLSLWAPLDDLPHHATTSSTKWSDREGLLVCSSPLPLGAHLAPPTHLTLTLAVAQGHQ